MKKVGIVVAFLFALALLVPAGVPLAEAGCGYAGPHPLQANKDVKEVEKEVEEGYSALVKDAQKDGNITDTERTALDLYRIEHGLSLARAEVIENGGS
ncbi:MAG: hypothetical protein ACE5JS_22720 [Nitrospinota bacterium]